MRFRDIWKNGTLTTLRDTSIRLDDMKKNGNPTEECPTKVDVSWKSKGVTG